MAVTSVTVAVVPETEKSAVPALTTVSEKVTRQTRLSASVGDTDGVWRVMEATVGAVSSFVTENCVAAVLSLPASSVATDPATSSVTGPSAAGVMVAV